MPHPTVYEAVIGLEIHAELLTRSKMFCGAPVVDTTSAAPNSAVLPLCLGLPGTLPVINRQAVEMALRVALALNCCVHPYNRFARKNYFYPDLPKGYQISQYEEPLATDGWLDVPLESAETRRIRIRRVHLEEDTGKLTHRDDGTSLVDYNRAGVPLLEIVTEPDIDSADLAAATATHLRHILRWLEVNSGELEKGVLRIEPNISIRPPGTTPLGTRTEIKNLNSFRILHQATLYELERQAAVLESGGRVVQETRGWNEAERRTFSQRSKEDAHDYRYLPEPDLPSLLLDQALIAQVRAALPELPVARQARYQSDWGLPAADARQLTAERAVALWYEAAVAAGAPPRAAANLLLNNLFSLIHSRGETIETVRVTPQGLADLLRQVQAGVINLNIAKQVLERMVAEGVEPAAIIARDGLAQVQDSDAIRATVRAVLAAHPQESADFQAGKLKLRGFLVGQIMRSLQGKGNPALVNQLLDQLLAE